MRGCWLIAALSLLTGVAQSSYGDPLPTYQFNVPVSLELVVGKPAELTIRIIPSDGFAVDRNGPIRIDLQLGEGSAFQPSKSILRRKHAKDPKSSSPRFVAVIKATAAGTEPLTLAYRFWLCRKKICRSVEGEAKVELKATASDPDQS